MVSKELSTLSKLCSICSGFEGDCYENYPALANENEIVTTARLLDSLGYEFVRNRTDTSTAAYFSAASEEGVNRTSLHSVVGRVGVLLDWLEQAGHRGLGELKKREAVLRGVLNLIELGNSASVIGMLEIVQEFLDVPDNPYPLEREYITGRLDEIQQQKKRIFEKTEKAGEILQKMIDVEAFDIAKGREFDNLIREANVDLAVCKGHLDRAKEAIKKLAGKIESVKWFSRFIRAIGFLVTFYFIYTKYQTSSMSFPAFVVTSFVSLALWISVAPNRAHAFGETLARFDDKHRMLSESLDDIYKRMEISSESKDEVVNDTTRDNEN